MKTSGEWVDLLAGGLGAEMFGPLAGLPALVAVLDGSETDHELARLTRDLPCVTVGLDRAGRARRGAPLDQSAPDLDVLLTTHPDPARPWVGTGDEGSALVTKAAAASPQASVSLVQLLRLGVSLDVGDALVAESFVYSMLQSGSEYNRWLTGRRRYQRPVSSEDSVLVDRDGSTLRVTFNRPQVRNAYNTEIRDGLVAALEVAHADPTVSDVHLRGVGAAFCSGGDLAEFGSTPDPVSAHVIRTTRSAARLLANCPAHTVARVHGACVGAGAELASFADEVIAAPGTYFMLPEVGMGLVPGAGGTAGLPRRIGRQRTAYLALTGVKLDVATAQAWGLVDSIAE